MTDVTQILSQIERGDLGAAEHLLPLIYEQLRSLAAKYQSASQSGSVI